MKKKDSISKLNGNRDILGNEWRLGRNGYRTIHHCQSDLSRLHAELNGYSALFKKLGPCEMADGELYGVGLTLERISVRLLRLSVRLAQALVLKKDVG